MNPIHHALLEVARHPEARASGNPHPQLPDVAAETVVAAARDHRLDGLLLREWLAAGLFDRLPVAERDAAESALRQLKLRSAMVQLEWPRLSEALRAGGIEAVALKGIHISERFYPEPVARQLRDIDILVERHELRQAVRILLRNGYRCLLDRDRLRGYLRHHFHLQLHHPHGFVVEVHWALTRPGSTYRLDADEVRKDARTTTGKQGAPMRVPSLEHTILMVVLQNVQEGFSYLSRTVDLDRLIRSSPGPDWDRLVELARPGNLGKPLAVSLQIARKSLGTPVPFSTVEALGVRVVSRFHLSLFRPVRFLLNQRATKRTSASSLLRLWMFPTFGGKARMLLSLVSNRFSDPLDWVWKNEPESRSARGRGTRLAAASKLWVYQSFLYVRGLFGILRRDADQLGFWSE